jgi:hypothetical protein
MTTTPTTQNPTNPQNPAPDLDLNLTPDVDLEEDLDPNEEVEKYLIYPAGIGDGEKYLWTELFKTLRQGIRFSYFELEKIPEIIHNFSISTDSQKTDYILYHNDKLFDLENETDDLIDMLDLLDSRAEIAKVCKNYPPQLKPIIELLAYSYLAGVEVSKEDLELAEAALSPKGVAYLNEYNINGNLDKYFARPKGQFNQPLTVEDLVGRIDAPLQATTLANNNPFDNPKITTLVTKPKTPTNSNSVSRSLPNPNLNNQSPSFNPQPQILPGNQGFLEQSPVFNPNQNKQPQASAFPVQKIEQVLNSQPHPIAPQTHFNPQPNSFQPPKAPNNPVLANGQMPTSTMQVNQPHFNPPQTTQPQNPRPLNNPNLANNQTFNRTLPSSQPLPAFSGGLPASFHPAKSEADRNLSLDDLLNQKS